MYLLVSRNNGTTRVRCRILWTHYQVLKKPSSLHSQISADIASCSVKFVARKKGGCPLKGNIFHGFVCAPLLALVMRPNKLCIFLTSFSDRAREKPALISRERLDVKKINKISNGAPAMGHPTCQRFFALRCQREKRFSIFRESRTFPLWAVRRWKPIGCTIKITILLLNRQIISNKWILRLNYISSF